MIVKKIKALLSLLLLTWVSIFLKPFFFFKRKKYFLYIDRPYWIDNAYFLYKYSKDKNTDTIKHLYLCKDKDDAKMKWFLQDRDILYYFSLRHFWYFIHADVLIFSYDTTPFYFNNQGLIFKKILKPKTKQVFLWHGYISMKGIPCYHKDITHFDYFLANSESEKNTISQMLWYHTELQVTWFPRYDNLFSHSSENKIIFMPTWNQKFQVPRSDFVKTDYYRYITQLLTSQEFVSILEKYNYSCVFVSHYLMEQYKDLFSFDTQRISFYDEKKDGGIANLLKTSSALITDYSSVYYDMLYMKKLWIIYRDIKIWAMWYKDEKLIFPACFEIVDVIQHLEEYFQTWKISDTDIVEIEKLFAYIDDKNCERNYEKILQL